MFLVQGFEDFFWRVAPDRRSKAREKRSEAIWALAFNAIGSDVKEALDF
jgi:hypothetical protein